MPSSPLTQIVIFEMIEIGPLKIPSPSVQGIERLPEFPESRVGSRIGRIDPIDEDVKIHGEALAMKAIHDALSFLSVHLRCFR